MATGKAAQEAGPAPKLHYNTSQNVTTLEHSIAGASNLKAVTLSFLIAAIGCSCTGRVVVLQMGSRSVFRNVEHCASCAQSGHDNRVSHRGN